MGINVGKYSSPMDPMDPMDHGVKSLFQQIWDPNMLQWDGSGDKILISHYDFLGDFVIL